MITKTKDGTKIDQKPFQKNWKAVRESLGILLSNNFLIADKTLLVEGPSDIVYLLDVIRRLKAQNKTDIDLNDFSVVDAGNSENFVALAKLMLSEGRDVVALVDGDTAGKRIKTKVEKSCQAELKKDRLKILSLSENKSIEDIFCDIATLKSSIHGLTNQLIQSNERVLVNDINLDNELKSSNHLLQNP